MDKFVNIISLSPESSNNDLSYLASLYDDEKTLVRSIKSVMNKILSKKIIEGKSVLLKPNWVMHSKTEEDDICMRTHDNFLLSTVKLLLPYKPSLIIIGDAPIQGCNWERAVSSGLLKKIDNLSNQYGINIEVKDFRRRTFSPQKNNPIQELNPITNYIIFDLGESSYLEEITNSKNTFRVTNYDPNRLAETHKKGMHKYCISKEIFDADIIISLPKIKTHQKTGITAALKNIVGINGDKDFLPHHRIGGTKLGGDCYPGKNHFRYLAELAQDYSNKHQGSFKYKVGIKISSLLWRMSFPKNVHQLAAGWHGNDTTWRMVLDLNKIITHGNADGTISTDVQRELFSLSDGIVGGQGNGPLKPIPLPLGIISFTNHSGYNDVAMATLMGFNANKIPMLKQFYNKLKNISCTILYNGKETSINELAEKHVKTIPPPGWKEYLS